MKLINFIAIHVEWYQIIKNQTHNHLQSIYLYVESAI